MSILFTVLTFNLTLAADKLKDGMYTSDHGNIHVLNSKSNKKAVGLYNSRGFLLLSPFSISGRGTVYTGAFSNNCKNGLVSFMVTSTNQWSGEWRWKTTTGANNWDGKWNGSFKTDNRLQRNDLNKTFQTDLGTLDLIQNEEGKVAGFLYAHDREYYVYGNFQNNKFKGYITTDESSIECNTGQNIEFEWNTGIYGAATIPGYNKKTFRGDSFKNKLEVVLQTIKNYENRGLMHGEEKGKITISTGLFDDKGMLFTKDLYKDTRHKTYKEGKAYEVNALASRDIFYSFNNDGLQQS
ncbi:hypothetical protein AAU57_05740 [Nonlabens sp. YIK11]|nr:hypothetical protein AAU57_05740 [Nonlabens sp. YIK11]